MTSGEVTNTEVGPVYGVVNKKRQTKENMPLDENNDQSAVYSQVQKPAIEGMCCDFLFFSFHEPLHMCTLYMNLV